MNIFQEIVLNQAIEMIKLLNEEREDNQLPIPNENTFIVDEKDGLLFTHSNKQIFYQIFLKGMEQCRLEIWRNNKETGYIRDIYTLLYAIPLHPLFSTEDNFQLYMIKNQL